MRRPVALLALLTMFASYAGALRCDMSGSAGGHANGTPGAGHHATHAAATPGTDSGTAPRHAGSGSLAHAQAGGCALVMTCGVTAIPPMDGGDEPGPLAPTRAQAMPSRELPLEASRTIDTPPPRRLV